MKFFLPISWFANPWISDRLALPCCSLSEGAGKSELRYEQSIPKGDAMLEFVSLLTISDPGIESAYLQPIFLIVSEMADLPETNVFLDIYGVNFSKNKYKHGNDSKRVVSQLLRHSITAVEHCPITSRIALPDHTISKPMDERIIQYYIY